MRRAGVLRRGPWRRARRVFAVAWLIGPLYAVLGAQGVLPTYERITVGSTAVGIATATTNPAGQSQMNWCTARLEAAPLYFRDDGTAPTATTGTPLEIGDVLDIENNAYARRIQFIRSTSTSGILNVRCYPQAPGGARR